MSEREKNNHICMHMCTHGEKKKKKRKKWKKHSDIDFKKYK